MSRRNKDFRVGKSVPAQPFVVSINGYGAPVDPLHDGNLDRYLREVFLCLNRVTFGPRVRAVYLCGGYTNHPSLTEAEAIRQWIAVREPAWLDRVHLLDQTTTLRDNIIAFRDVLADNEHPILFCEWSRRYTVEVLARHFLGQPIAVEGIKFDEASLSFKNQAKQLFVKLPVEWLSLHSSWVEGRRVKARREHVARERERMEAILAARGT